MKSIVQQIFSVGSVFISLSFLLLMYQVQGFADRAAYYIQNVFDGSCITGGPVVDTDKPSIFKKGVVLTMNCSHQLNQQWVLKETGFETYKLRSFNSKDTNQLLNAQVTGEFITYFPGPVEIHETKNITTTNKTGFYKFIDASSTACYNSMGQNHVLHLDQCNRNVTSQLWSFSLVNEPPSANCTSFWGCNAS